MTSEADIKGLVSLKFLRPCLNRRRSVGVKDPDEPDVRIVGEIFQRVGGIVKYGARDGERCARVAAQTALAHRSIFSFENGP